VTQALDCALPSIPGIAAFLATLPHMPQPTTRRLPATRSVTPDGTPFGVWCAALPVWIALLALALRFAPDTSYLVSIPLPSASPSSAAPLTPTATPGARPTPGAEVP